eukprot:TRINITY_DN4728_c0_g1_i1.p1 TRINITY_DN4728_c0_g1~~TRINITY_DN4728_c0_g1_i1.p1  ORF type:complete len:2900 (-),score=526.70 TRINITY_DN4728_c0_g1_i1:35-8038(-)
MNSYVYSNSNIVSHSFVMHPCHGQLRLTLNVDENDFNHPKSTLDFVLEGTNISFNSTQYRNLFSTIEFFTMYFKAVQHNLGVMRPSLEILPKENPSEWWKYIIKSMSNKAKKVRNRWSWETITKFKSDEEKYIRITELKRDGRKLAKDTEMICYEIERHHSFDDLLLWRRAGSLSYAAKEWAKKKAGIIGLFENKPVIIDWRSIYQSIEDIEEDESKLFPKDYKQIEMSFDLRNGSLSLVNATNDNFIYSTYSRIQSNLSFFQECLQISNNIIDLDMFSLKNTEYIPLAGPLYDNKGNSMLYVNIEVKPVDKPADLFFQITAQPLVINWTTEVIDECIKFFDLGIDLEGLMNLPLEILKEQTLMLLQASLEEREEVMLELDIAAPRIVFNSGKEDVPLMIADLGHLKMHSELPDTSDFRSLSGNSDDYFYDTYKIDMDKIHIYFSDTSKSDNKDYLIHEFDVKLVWKLRRLVPTLQLPAVVLNGWVEKLSISNSIKKTSDFFRILNSMDLGMLDPKNNQFNLSLIEEAQMFSTNTEFAIFSAHFELGLLEFVIEKVKNSSRHILANLQLNNLTCDIDSSTLKTVISAQLHNLNIDSPTNPKIATSTLDREGLATVTFTSDNRSNNDLLDISFNKLELAPTRKTATAIFKYLLDIQNIVGVVEDPTVQTPVSKNITILGSSNLLRLKLMEDNNSLLTVNISDFDIDVSILGSNVAVSGYLGSVTANDEKKNLWSDIISIHGDKMVQFNIETYDNSEVNPGYSTSIKMDVATIEIHFLGSLVSNIINYMLPVTKVIHKATIKKGTGSNSDKATDKTLVDISIANPLVKIPISDHDESHFVVNLGSIHICSDEKLESLCMDVFQLKIESSFLNEYDLVLEDGNMNILLGNGFIDINSDNIHWNLNRSHVILAIEIISQNVFPLIDKSIGFTELPVSDMTSNNSDFAIQVCMKAVSFTLSGNDQIISFVNRDAQARISTYSDGNLFFNFNVRSFLLQDERGDQQNVLRDIISPNKDDESFKMDIRITPTGDAKININIGECTIIPIPDVILSCYDYFAPLNEKINQMAILFQTIDKSAVIPNSPAKMSLRVEIEPSSIFILQEYNKNKTTAFVLSFKFLTLDIIESGDENYFSLDCINFEAFTSSMSNELVSDNHVQMISPLNIQFFIVETEDKIRFSGSSDNLIVLVSFQDINSLSRIIRNCISFGENFIDITREKIVPYVLQNENVEKETEVEYIINQFNLSVLDDHSAYDFIRPVFQLNVKSLNLNVKSDAVKSTTGILVDSLILNYFNFKLNSWEPIVEPFTVYFTVTSDEEGTIIFSETEKLLVNLSPSITKGVVQTVSFVESGINILLDQNPDDSIFNIEERANYPVMISNETGYPLKFWISFQENLDGFQLEQGDSLPVKVHNYSRDSNRYNPEHDIIHLSILCEGYTTVPDIDIGKVNTNIIEFVNIEDPMSRLVVDVQYNKGCKLVTVRSNYTIINKTEDTFELNLIGQEHSELIKVLPQMKYHLPLSLMKNLDFELFFRISEDDLWYNWNFEDTKITLGNRNYILSIETKSFGGKEDFKIYIEPPILVKNLLPLPVTFTGIDRNSKEHNYYLLSGQTVNVIHKDIIKYTVSLPGCMLSRPQDIYKTTIEKKYSLEDVNDGNKTYIQTDFSIKRSTVKMVLFCKYWIVNNTNLQLKYKKRSQSLYGGQSDPYPRSITDDNLYDPPSWYDNSNETRYYGENGTNNIFLFGDDNLSISVEESSFSPVFDLSPETNSVITVVDEESKRAYMLLYNISSAGTKFWRSNILRFRPAFILVNMTEEILQYRQTRQKSSFALSPGGQVPFHWSQYDFPQFLQVSMDGYSWSPEIDIDKLDNFKFKISGSFADERIISSEIKQKDDVTFIIISENNPSIVGYKIRNRTDIVLFAKQENCRITIPLEPGFEYDYYWEKPQSPEKKIQILYKSSTGVLKHISSIEFDDVGPCKPERVGRRFWLAKNIVVDNMSKVLILQKSTDDTHIMEETEFGQDRYKFKIGEIGVSLITEVRNTQKEFSYISLKQIAANYRKTNLQTYIDLKVASFQVDNQIYLTPYSVVLDSVNKEEFLHISAVLKNTDFSYLYFRYLGMIIGQFDISIDQIFLSYLVHTISEIFEIVSSQLNIKTVNSVISGERIDVLNLWDPKFNDPELIYFELFHINSTTATISFSTATMPAGDLDQSTLDIVLKLIAFFANVERSPIMLPALFIEHPFCHRKEFIDRIITHYRNNVLLQIVSLIFNADFLGSPVSLISSLGYGAKSFFYEPAKGIVKSPQDFAVGVGRGTNLLLRNTFYGVFNTIQKITGSVNKIGELTLNEESRKRREINKQKQASNVLEGIGYGFRDLGKGLFSGITGIIREPIRGGQKEGVGGALLGAARGVSGIVVRPAMGAIDLVGRIAEGVKNNAIDVGKERARKPRYFDQNNLLTIYDEYLAHGQELLYIIDKGRFKDDTYVLHVPFNSTTWILLSDKNLFRIKWDEFFQTWNLEWRCDLTRIELKSIRKNTISLTQYDSNWKTYEKDIVLHNMDAFSELKSALLPLKILHWTHIEKPITGRGRSGWLFKRGEHSIELKKRWFHLENGEMTYQKFKTTSVLGRIEVQGNKILCVNVENMKNNFTILTMNRAYHLEAANEHIKRRWISACIGQGAHFEQ